MVAGRLQEKNGYFYVVLSYKNAEGKRKEPWFSTGLQVRGNKKKAELILTDHRARFDIVTEKLLPPADEKKEVARQVEKVEKTEKPQILFGDYLKSWVDGMRGLIEETTYSAYRGGVYNIIAPYFNERGITLQNLKADDIAAFYQFKLKDVKPNTIKHYHAYIREALQNAFVHDLIPSNIADKVRLPKVETFIGDYYNSEELKRLFACVKGNTIEFPVLMAAFYGLRRSEIVGLKWSAIDFTYKTITIRHTVTDAMVDGKYTQIRKDRAKNKKSIRTLPLFENIEKMLLAMKREQDENRALFGNSYHTEDSEYIYVNMVGDLIDPGFVTQNFSLTLQNNGLRKIRFHDLRHSCATLLRHNGAKMEDIQKWLGHSNITTTEKTYAHFENREYLISAKRISDALCSEDEKENEDFDEPQPRKKERDFEM